MGQREAMVAAAASQLGFREGAANATPFGAWYGMDNQPWCAMFVSWCAAQAGVAELLPRFSYVPSGVAWFRSRAQWQGRGYTPQPGDIVFYGAGSHVGVVERCDGRTVTAIEGNTSARGNSSNGDGVYRRSRAVNNSWIMGYGLPAYEEDEMSYEQFKEYMEQYVAEQGETAPSPWSAAARAWAEQTGVIRGNSSGSKKYRQFCTREQVAVMLKRLAELDKA